jgi:uncharacterized membrane protein YdfJ with MMPL/SSD domain
MMRNNKLQTSFFDKLFVSFAILVFIFSIVLLVFLVVFSPEEQKVCYKEIVQLFSKN